MKLLVALALIGLVGSVAEEVVAPIKLEYHNKTIIPVAASIKAAEEALDIDVARIVDGASGVLGLLSKDPIPDLEFVAPIELEYHNKIGIPEATRIKAAEEALDIDDARIGGGAAAALAQDPYLGGLIITLTTGATSVCSSTLLSNTCSVTAAHCWRSIGGSARQFIVVLGSTLLFSGGTRVTTTNVRMHPNYNMNTFVNDVAVIRMPRVTYTEYINNIGLASGTNQFVNTWAQTAGFGRSNDSVGISHIQFLSLVQMQVITNEDCASTYGNGIVQASTICVATTGGRGTCGGYSGGPLVANNQLIGIYSFGHFSGCQSGFPAVFARVTSFNSWISAFL